MSLENTKTLLGVDNERVTIIYEQIEGRLLRRLQKHLPDILAIPDELDYIVTECAIARYNRIGSEGMESESMDGHSASYVDKDLSDYEDDILDYLGDDASGSKRGVVRFL